jgi:hypothetical protein
MNIHITAMYARHPGCDLTHRERALVSLGLAGGTNVVEHAVLIERPMEDTVVACSVEERRVCLLGTAAGAGGGAGSNNKRKVQQ